MPEVGTWTSIALGVALSLWLVATIVNSTPWGYRKFGGHGFHHFLPRWNFFAPNPGIVDYHLLYRDEFVDGGLGPWREAPGFQQPRDATAAVWNPDKYGKKALFDLAQELVRMHPEADSGRATDAGAQIHDSEDLTPVESEVIKITTPYLTLLNYVSSLQRSEMSVATQFLLMREVESEGTMEPLFLSDFHEV